MTYEFLTLSSGRTMAWETFGDPAGTPLMALHGSADSRLIWRLFEDDAETCGVRLIAPDRPGFGASPRVDRYTTSDHARDVLELADHLRIGSFPVISVSGGLVFGLTLTHAHPERVSRFTSYAGLFLTAPGAAEEMNPLQRAIVRVGFAMPWTLRPLSWLLFGPQVLLAQRFPKAVYGMLRATRPAGDKDVMGRAEVRALLEPGIPGQFRSVQAVREALVDQQLPPFSFELHEIQQEVHVWQGGCDDVHTEAMGRHVADECANATLHLFPELATFDFVEHYEEMIRVAVGAADPSTT